MAAGADDLDEPPEPEEFRAELLTSHPDRVILYAMAVLIVLMGIFVVYTGYQLRQIDEERQELLVAVRHQERNLVCFADASTEFQLVLAEALEERDGLPPLVRAQLESAKNSLRDARTVCFGTVDRPVVPGPATTR